MKMPTRNDKDEEVWLPMGPEARTNKLNFTIKPVGVAMGNYKWRRMLEVRSKAADGAAFTLNYKLGGPGTEAICAGRGGCKKPLNECKCDEESRESNPPPKRAREAYEDRVDKRERGQGAFFERYALKEQKRCPHFLVEGVGRCVRGSRCGMIHAGDAAAWFLIPCDVARLPGGRCKAKGNCIYKNCPSAP